MSRLKRTDALVMASLIAILTLLPILHAGAKDDRSGQESGHGGGEPHHASPHGPSSSGGPLVSEMNILDAAFREIVSAVSLGDGQRVHRALEPMHGTMERTHEGVYHGTVKLRKNADQMEAFVNMDKAFHAELEKLAGAAHRNDRKTMLAITQDLLKGCVDCHDRYRP